MTARTTTLGPPRSPAAMRAAKGRHPAAHRRVQAPAPVRFYLLFGVVVVLTLLGLVMVLSASSVTALHAGGSSWVYFEKQAMWTVFGLVALIIGMKVDHHVWRRLVTPALFGSFALMVAVLVPGIGVKVNGARAWIALGPVSVQPVELLKLALLVYAADLLARRADRMAEVRSTFFPLLSVLAAASVLTLLQPDLGGLIVVASIVLSMAFIAGTPLIPFGAITASVAAIGAGFVLTHRRDRWLAFTDLAKYKESEGWQVWQSLIGIASGGVTGAGLGASKAKWGYLPEAHTDFIFAIIGEELGLLGALLVCLLFFMFAVIGVQVALRAPDRYGMLLAGGITAWVAVQAIINIGGVVGIMPLTGLTLPFVSFGGSSLLVMLAAAGILLNIARQSP